MVTGYKLQIITPRSDPLITLNVDANYFIVRMIFDYTLKLLEASLGNFNQKIVNYGIQIWDFLIQFSKSVIYNTILVEITIRSSILFNCNALSENILLDALYYSTVWIMHKIDYIMSMKKY